MNLQQLTTFSEVMKTGSLSQAARNMHRTQPAISASLKTLEENLGMSLFKRQGRKLVPVPEAYYLLSAATDILGRVKTAEQNLLNMREKISGNIRIVAMPGPSAFLVPEFLSNFVSDRGEIRVTLATRSSPQVRTLIGAQHFDIGFCDASAGEEQLELYDSIDLPGVCVCALPLNHRLAAKEVVLPQDLDGEPMGALQPEHTTYRQAVRAFGNAGADFNLHFDAQYFLPLFHFIEAGKACAIVDALSAESYLRANQENPKIVFRKISPPIDYGYSVLTPKHLPQSLIVEQFIEEWINHVKRIVAKIGRF